MEAVGTAQLGRLGARHLLVLPLDFGEPGPGSQDAVVRDYGRVAVAHLVAADDRGGAILHGNPRALRDVERPVGLELVEARQAWGRAGAGAAANLRRLIRRRQQR